MRGGDAKTGLTASALASSSDGRPEKALRWRLIASRDFGALWWGQLVSQIGDGLTKVALLWFVLQLTGSALNTAVVGVLQTVPPLLLSPLLGVYLDALPKKHVMLAADLARAAVLAAIPALHALDALTLEGLYGLVFLNAIVSTVFGPALAASVPQLVGPAQLMTANALIQSTTNAGVLVGPAVSGVLIALLSPPAVLYVDALTFLASAGCLVLIRAPLRGCSGSCPATLRTTVQQLRAGLRFVFAQQRDLRMLVITTALYTLGTGSFVYLLPLVVKDRMHAGSIELGWLWSALGAGMLAASLALTMFHGLDIRTRLRLLAGALVLQGLLTATLAQLSTLPLAVAVVALIGASTGAFTPVGWSIMQEVTPQGLRARVFAIAGSGSMATASAGMVTFGWISDVFGATAGLGSVALVLLGTAGLLARHSPPDARQEPDPAGSMVTPPWSSDLRLCAVGPVSRPTEPGTLLWRRGARPAPLRPPPSDSRAVPRAPPTSVSGDGRGGTSRT